jgi:hypothetical protein
MQNEPSFELAYHMGLECPAQAKFLEDEVVILLRR